MKNQNNRLERDLHYLGRTLRLASKGEGQVAPNPMVGAVIVNNGFVVGEGFHRFDGVTHAEVLAIRQAGLLARGGTAYINLEPCCHSGEGKRTPPCVDALLEAGIERVVCCTEDPNPKVAGQGFVALRAAGVEVLFGLKADAARELNAEYFESMLASYREFVEITKFERLYGATTFQFPALLLKSNRPLLDRNTLF